MSSCLEFINYQKVGSKLPEATAIIMLHGWGLNLESLKPLAHLLSSYHEPYLIDLPGFGYSEPPESAWTAFDYADRLAKFMNDQGIDRADFLGHSFGGKVAICFAARYPTRIGYLILMAPSGIPKKRNLLGYMKLKILKTAAICLKLTDRVIKTTIYKDYFIKKFGSFDYQNAVGVMRQILVKSVNEDLSAVAQEVQAPTLILWGKLDTETPIEIAFRLKSLIKRAELIIFPHQKHWIWQDTAAHLCAYQIKQFIQLQGKF
jgi:pimeloyl-ACP methyl ester carboxylesterase